MAVKFLDNTGLGYFWSKIKAWCNATFAVITHNQASNTINAMTGYSKPNSGSAITTSDSLNSAIGKLEAKVDAVDSSNVVHITGGETITGAKGFTEDIRLRKSAYSILLRNDGSDFYILITNQNDPDGSWNSLRPIRINNFTGYVYNETQTFFYNNIHLKVASLDYYNPPSSNLNVYLAAEDAYGRAYTGVQFTSSSSHTRTSLRVIKVRSTNHDLSQAIDMGLESNPDHPNGFGYCPTYDVPSSNSDIIATTAWIRTATGNTTMNAANVTGTVAIGHGGTGATTRLNACKNLLNEGITASNANYFVAVKTGWDAVGYCSVAQTKSALGISDKRMKQDFASIPENILDAWDEIEWLQFKFKHEIRDLHDNAKIHIGATVQDIQEILDKHNVEHDLYAMLYHENYPDEEKDLPSEENPEVLNKDKWHLAYKEALCVEAAYQRRKNKILENRISELERQVSDMLQILQSLKGAN